MLKLSSSKSPTYKYLYFAIMGEKNDMMESWSILCIKHFQIKNVWLKLACTFKKKLQ